MSDFDNPWKEALASYFEQFIAFFHPRRHAEIDWKRDYESLDGELRKLFPDSETGKLFVDRLVKVWLTEEHGGDSRLMHVEFQAQREGAFDRRMYQYNTGAEMQTGDHVVSLAVLGDEDPAWRPGEYIFESMGCRKTFSWPVVKLLDWSGKEDELLAHTNPFALLTLAHLKAKETHGDDEARAQWKERLLKNLAMRGLAMVDLRRWYGILEFLLNLPDEYNRRVWDAMREFSKEKKMPFVTWADKVGREEGLIQGKRE